MKQLLNLWTVVSLTAVMAGASSVPAGAVPITFTDRTAWEAAVNSVDAGADIRKEDINDDPISPSTGLAPGSTSFGGGDIVMTLNDVGSGGSFTGIINPGEFDASNALEMRLVDDTSDIFIGFILQGEGAELLRHPGGPIRPRGSRAHRTQQ